MNKVNKPFIEYFVTVKYDLKNSENLPDLDVLIFMDPLVTFYVREF